MRKSFLRYTLSFSIAIVSILIPCRVAKSCGPILSADESRFALFRQGLDNNSGLLPFNYGELAFNAIGPDPAELDRKQNCKEWVSFCGGKVKAGDVYAVQYTVTEGSFLRFFKYPERSELADNSFIKWLFQKPNKAALDYMLLAKESESTQFVQETDPWDTNTVVANIQTEDIALRAVSALKHCSSYFLKERYAFQAIKMYHYTNNWSDKNCAASLQGLYENYLSSSKSIVAGWALIYYAMSQVNAERRCSLLLSAFERSHEKKEFCFSHISNNDLESLIKNSNDNKLLCLAHTMRALKSRGKMLGELKAVNHYDKNSKYLPLLLSREINKLENWIWSPEMLNFSENYRADIPDTVRMTEELQTTLMQRDRLYLGELVNFIKGIHTSNHNYSIFLKLALAHLYNMQRDFGNARLILKRLGTVVDTAKQTQQLIEEVITSANLDDITQKRTQEKLAGFINRMIVLNPVFKEELDRQHYNIWDHDAGNEGNDDVSELMILLSKQFQQKGDHLLAGLLYNKSNHTKNNYDGGDDTYRNIAWFDRYASVADIDKLLAFKHKKNKTAFEQLVCPGNWSSDDQYKDLKGTILFRQQKYREALAVFKTMNPAYWGTKEYGNELPITSVAHTGKMIPSEKSIPAKYAIRSKIPILEEIIHLQDAISTAKDNAMKAELYYQLANAWFNTSYNGKAWMMFSYGKTNGEENGTDPGNYNWSYFDFYPNNIRYGDDYYGCHRVIETYKKALTLTKDKELAAKCLLSLATCEKIRFYYLEAIGTKKNIFYQDSYLQQLAASYKNTNAFREAAVHCPDVKDYLKGH